MKEMAAPTKTREERSKELKRFAAMPNGVNLIHTILLRSCRDFDKLPIGTAMIEAILAHEYPDGKR